MNIRLVLQAALVWSSLVPSVSETTEGAPRLLSRSDLPNVVDPTILERQFNALSAMPSIKVEYSLRGPVHILEGDTGIVIPVALRGIAEGVDASELVPILKDVLLASGDETLVVRSHTDVDEAYRSLRLTQSILGIPVIHGGVAIRYERATGLVTVLSANFLPDRNLPRQVKLSSERAEQAVAEFLASSEAIPADRIEFLDQSKLAYFASANDGTPTHLVWFVRAMHRGDHYVYFVDAEVGTIVGREQQNFSSTR